MFKKKKAAEKEARLAARAEIEEKFTAEIGAVEEIKDPAEQLLKVMEIQNGIKAYAQELSSEISKDSGKFGNIVAVGGLGLLAGGTMVSTASICSFLPLALGLFPFSALVLP